MRAKIGEGTGMCNVGRERYVCVSRVNEGYGKSAGGCVNDREEEVTFERSVLARVQSAVVRDAGRGSRCLICRIQSGRAMC
jgi:hypothetical protein